jgi:hypothetical protein
MIGEANVFVWPGHDLRPAPGRGSDSVAYGFLPPGFFRTVLEAYLALDAKRKVSFVPRDE